MLAATSPTLYVLLCLGLVTADVKTVFDKSEKYNKTVQLYSLNIHNSLMTAVTCNELSNSESIKKCNVSLTTLDSESKSTSCEFVLDKNSHEPSGHPFTSNKAILISQTKKNSEELYNKYMIVNFDDCKTTEAKINFETFRAVDANFDENQDAILIKEDQSTFDILYNDPKVCGKRACIMTLSDLGKKERGYSTFFIPVVGSYRFVKKIPSSSNFIVTELKLGETYKISLIKSDEQVVLKEYKTYDDWMDHSVSTSHGSIRLCSKTNTTKVDCELFDNSGKTTSKISVDANQKVETVAVENLANGEFLLLVEEETSAVMKVKGDGSVLGVAKLSPFVRGSYSKYESYVDVSNNQYCVTRGCHGHGNLKILKECYSDSDFH